MRGKRSALRTSSRGNQSHPHTAYHRTWKDSHTHGGPDMGKKLIAAKPTHYNGVIYRSRNEAKVAIFLHEAEIQFEFEPQGSTQHGLFYYKVDFFLPEMNWFIEVKPRKYLKEGITREAKIKALTLAERTGIPVAFCFGINWSHKDPCIDPLLVVDPHRNWYADFHFKQCLFCKRIGIYSQHNNECVDCQKHVCTTDVLRDAMEIARLTRFAD